MSNEELAARIQDGQTELFGELWEQVRRWVICLARRRLPDDKSTNKIELEDLTQAGYIAMVNAVKAFERDSSNSFIAYLNNHLKTAFAEELGYRTSRRDALRSADSLDKPLPGGGDYFSLLSAIPDAYAEEEIYNIDQRLTIQRDYETVINEIGHLDEKRRSILLSHYVDKQTQGEISQKLGISQNRVSQYMYDAFRQLRRRKAIKDIAENYVNARVSPYRNKSVKAFHSSGSSAVEDIVELREWMMQIKLRNMV